MKYIYLKEENQNTKSDTSKVVLIFIAFVFIVVNILNTISILF